MTATLTWQGAEDLRSDLVPIDSLSPHPRNPRRGDVEEIKGSLTRFGQTQQVLVDPARVIVAGNHTFLAARELGWTHIAAIPNEFADEGEARAYLLADNRLGDLGEYERTELRLLVEELDETGRYDGTGYQPDDLAHLRALDDLANQPPPEPAAPGPAPAPAPANREVVLLLTEDQFAAFSTGLRVLRERYALEGVTETILRAVREEALHLNQGEPDD